MLQDFKKRFSGMKIDILWTTILDPRCRSLKHLSKAERKASKETLMDEVMKVLKSEQKSKPIIIDDEHEGDSQVFVHSFDIFDSPIKSYTTGTQGDEEEETKESELLRNSAVREVEPYLDHSMRVSPEVSSLSWWKDHKHQFPHVSSVARKWLCVPATSTPSERVFSDCGLALTAKRSRLKGDILRDQVMIRRNLRCLNITDDDIEAKFSK